MTDRLRRVLFLCAHQRQPRVNAQTTHEEICVLGLKIATIGWQWPGPRVVLVMFFFLDDMNLTPNASQLNE